MGNWAETRKMHAAVLVLCWLCYLASESWVVGLHAGLYADLELFALALVS